MPRQFVRFLIVGAGNALFGYAVFSTTVLAGLNPTPALIITYIIGVIFNFFTTGRFVFGGARASAFLRFVVAYVVIYLFNVVLFKLIAITGTGALVDQAICIPLVAAFSFVLFKFHVFREGAGIPGGHRSSKASE
jgi:putative flippase GtrA